VWDNETKDINIFAKHTKQVKIMLHCFMPNHDKLKNMLVKIEPSWVVLCRIMLGAKRTSLTIN